MGDPNGCLDSPLSMPLTDSISPPSLKDPRYERNDVYRMESPLLDTELLPNDDHQACPYCHRGFRKPRVLDCLHSMCEDCIIAQLDGRREAQKAHELMNTRDSTDFELEAPKVNTRPTPPGVIRCPICAQETHVGNDVRFVHGLLLDYVKLNENDDTRSTQVPPAQVERRCRACKSEQAAIAFCKQCQSDLCSNCLTAHGLMRMFDGHNPVHYAELSGGSGDRCETRAVVCPHHHQPYKVLCATCEHLACKTCLEMEHLHHKVIEVNDRVVTAIEAEIRGLVNNVDHQWRNSMAEWSSIPDRSASLHDQYETAKARLENNFELISQLLEESRQRKIKELEEARIKQEHAIEELYRKMNLNESRVSDALSFTRQLLEKANGMELIASRKKVVQQLNNLAHTMPALGIQIELEYQPMTKKQAEQQLAAICGSVSARMCSTMKESLSMDQIRGTPSTDQSATSSGGAGPIASSGSSEWPRLNGNTASAPNLPAIGTERKKGAGSGITTRGSTDSFGGWPPSSNPPDLPSISPPLQQQNKDMNLPTPLGPGPQGIHSAIYSNYAWPPSSNPSLQQNPQAQALLRQQLAMAALLQNNAAMNGHNSAAAAANALLVQQQARIRAAQVLQQQQQQQQNDPLLASISGLSLSGTSGFDAPGQRTSPQEQQQGRLNELKIHSVFGTSQSGSTIRELHCPSGFCLSESDDILIADTNNHRVTVCGPPAPWKIGKTGTEDGMLCFPRKVVALKGSPIVRYLIFDKGADGKTRAQIFNNRGEFEKKVQIAHGVIPRGGVEVTAATCTTEGYLLFVDATCGVFCLDVDKERVLSWFDASKQLGEASDVAYYEEKVYITDFKNHCVQVFALNGEFIRKLGEPSQTPYPIGIDISKNGDILVADTHGNHLHVVVFSSDGSLIQSFTHNEFRLSRCVGLRVAGSGHIVTLCKHNHTLFVFKPLFIR